MLATLENAFTTTLMDLSVLRRTNLDLDFHYHAKQVDLAVGWLCDAAEAGEDVRDLAWRAHHAVLQLAELLDDAESDDRRTRDKLDLARDAIGELLEVLEAVVNGRISKRDCAVIPIG